MHLAKRVPGSRPYTLFDFFDDDFLLLIDESHVTLPQLNAMYKADRCRKTTLIEHGFRLPSALENRPMKFEEIEKFMKNTIFVSATPGDFEKEHSEKIVKQLIRPTGLLDPLIEVRPLSNQVDDCIEAIREATSKGERSIVTTLTKKGAERLSDYLNELGIRVSYLHSEMDAIERVRVLTKLKNGDFDCIIGINLLREGIDLPEVALVAILDADKEGFLRSGKALIQVAGRAARNANGRVILYGDVITPSMNELITTSNEHRKIQMEYNEKHHIIPKTIVKKERLTISEIVALSDPKQQKTKSKFDKIGKLDKNNPLAQNANMTLSEEDLDDIIRELEQEMYEAAEKLEFERAADLRDQIKSIRKA
jgi:excinuclease ABC subunit B